MPLTVERHHENWRSPAHETRAARQLMLRGNLPWPIDEPAGGRYRTYDVQAAAAVVIDGSLVSRHHIHMKRTNLVLNEDLLDEAVRLSGERTYSRAVERALTDFVRRAKARQILELTGSGTWEGDLQVMRADRPRGKVKRGSR
jgi:Arc/MetJ family transcription regulator